MTVEEAMSVRPVTARVTVPCGRCGRDVATQPRYLKVRGSATCVSCRNRARDGATRQKIGEGVARSRRTSRKARVPKGQGFRTEAWKQGMADLQRERWRELRQRHREVMRAKWKDPAYRARQDALRVDASWLKARSEGSRKAWEDPSYRAAATERARARWRDPAARARMLEAWQRQRVSRLNETVSGILTQLGVEHVLEHRVGWYRFDVFVPSRSLLIELNGEYWHSLPRAMRNDRSKATYVERYHPELKLATIWEVEFGKEGRVRHLLGRLLGLDDGERTEVDLSRCVVVEVTARRASDFYAVHHYLGTRRGGRHFGLVSGDELIGCCTFSPFQRRQQVDKYRKGTVELSRFCLHGGRVADNMGSWFLSRCLRAVARPVVTYADTTHGHDGTLYRATNFRFSHEVAPDYWWADADGFAMHKRTAWGKATQMGLTEQQYADRHGLVRRWGGPKLCFTYGL